MRPIAAATGRKVDERWAELTSPQEMEALRRVLGLLFEKVREDAPARQDARPGG